jgi:hypothetical protein
VNAHGPETPKIITERIPPDYRSLPEAERLEIARKPARQVRARLGPGATISSQLGVPGG